MIVKKVKLGFLWFLKKLKFPLKFSNILVLAQEFYLILVENSYLRVPPIFLMFLSCLPRLPGAESTNIHSAYV